MKKFLSFSIGFVIFLSGCGQSYNSTLQSEKINDVAKIAFKPLLSNSPGGQAVILEAMKKEFRKRGYEITEPNNADIIISGSATIESSIHYAGINVTSAVINVNDQAGHDLGAIESQAGAALSEFPESFGKNVAQKIITQIQKKKA